MRKLFLPLLLLTPLLAPAQTKKIAHRSHSGAASVFSPVSGNDDFGLRSSDYKRRADSTRQQEASSQRPATRKTKTKLKRRPRQ